MSTPPQLQLKYIQAGNARIHYIEAGSPALPTLLLCHGFLSSALQFRTLIPLLSSHYHILAPTLPGFGNTLPAADYTYTYASLAATLASFLTALHIRSYAAYVFDHAAPILLRVALNPPPGTSLVALISQNANLYADGLDPQFWAPVQSLWKSGNSPAAREAVRAELLTLEAIELQYRAGVPQSKQELIDVSSYSLDYLENLAPAAERQEIMLDLLYDYRTNVELYPRFQRWLRDARLPLLAVWGKGDTGLRAAVGAEAFRRDVPDARVRLLDTGHFALATDVDVIADEVGAFLDGVRF